MSGVLPDQQAPGGETPDSAVDIATVPDVQNSHCLLPVVDFVDHAVGPDADAPSFATRQLAAAGRPGILRKSLDGVSDSLVGARRQLSQFSQRPSQDGDGVAHSAISLDFRGRLRERNRLIAGGLRGVVRTERFQFF
jgi:hypothetical protein